MIDIAVEDGRSIESEFSALYLQYLVECGVNCDPASVEEFLRPILDNPSYFFIIAREINQIVGFIVAQYTVSAALLKPAVYGQDFFVSPERRRSECSEALLREFYRHSRGSGACRIFMNTAREKVSYFERRGWRVEDQALMYYDVY